MEDNTLLTNREIFDIYWNNGLIERCITCQFKKNKSDFELIDDFRQDLCLILLTYDNEKLNDAHNNNHFNAFLTRIIQNNIFSKQSPYYAKYKRFRDRTDEITEDELNLPTDYDFRFRAITKSARTTED